MSKIIQFMHRGTVSKCRKKIDNIPWNNSGSHKRKLIKSKIKYLENGEVKCGEGYFWGEWEPESRCEKENDFFVHTIKYPSNITENLKTNCCNSKCKVNANHLNTDPYVFGDFFIYSNCMQDRYKKLKRLDEGDIILFGSRKVKDGAFVLDTVFVIDKIIDKSTTSACFKFATGILLNGDYTIYKGKTHTNNTEEFFSFFPCDTKCFDRPVIDIDGLSKQTQGIHYIYSENIKTVWKKIKNQVQKQSKIGVWAKEPKEELK